MTSTQRIADSAPIELPTTRTHLFDPPPELASLRDQRPLCRLRYPDGHIGWLVTSHVLAKAVMNDSRFSARGAMKRLPVGDPLKLAAICDALDAEGVNVANLLALDAPDHTRVRRLLAAKFTVRQVNANRARVERIVQSRLDAMEQAGPPVDLKKMFASPVALSVQCELIGIQERDAGRFLHLHEKAFDPTATADEPIKAVRELRDYLQPMIQQKRLEPRDDLITYVVNSGELSDDEVMSTIQMFFDAGVDTVSTMLALGTFALLSYPGQLEALRADPSAIESAVEELLRYLTIFQVGALTRTAREDVDLEGTLIKAGDSVTVSLAAANRDPEKFETPDALNVRRSERGHLAFGHGAHICLGAHLARLEMQIGFNELLRRFPTLRLAVPIEDVRVYTGEQFAYGVHELPVAW